MLSGWCASTVTLALVHTALWASAVREGRRAPIWTETSITSSLVRAPRVRAGEPSVRGWTHARASARGRQQRPLSLDPCARRLLQDDAQSHHGLDVQDRSRSGPRRAQPGLAAGQVLGGSSSINGLLYIRGHRTDFDTWRQLGCTGWSFDDVLPYFMRSEDQERGGDDLHGAAPAGRQQYAHLPRDLRSLHCRGRDGRSTAQ